MAVTSLVPPEDSAWLRRPALAVTPPYRVSPSAETPTSPHQGAAALPQVTLVGRAGSELQSLLCPSFLLARRSPAGLPASVRRSCSSGSPLRWSCRSKNVRTVVGAPCAFREAGATAEPGPRMHSPPASLSTVLAGCGACAGGQPRVARGPGACHAGPASLVLPALYVPTSRRRVVFISETARAHCGRLVPAFPWAPPPVRAAGGRRVRPA